MNNFKGFHLKWLITRRKQEKLVTWSTCSRAGYGNSTWSYLLADVITCMTSFMLICLHLWSTEQFCMTFTGCTGELTISFSFFKKSLVLSGFTRCRKLSLLSLEGILLLQSFKSGCKHQTVHVCPFTTNIMKNPINHLNFQKNFQDDHSFYLKKQQF